MLENEYVYLCPAEKLDDPTECATTVDIERLIDLENNNLKWECVSQIISLLKPYMSEENFEVARSKILMICNGNGTVRPHLMLDIVHELQEMVSSEVNVAPFVNWIVNIPEKLDDPEIKEQLQPAVALAYNARREMGICSLAPSSDIDYMWKNYADDLKGYCVEYDVSEYELNKEILPVIYQDERQTNIIVQLVGSLIGQLITGISHGEIRADATQFLRLFLTKYKKWEYQQEWRLIGHAGDKPKAPKVKAIYLGKNMSPENKNKLVEFAIEHNIEIKNR